ncbi:MAG: gamma-glutamyltransferase, partial [Verrucomicrobia bacterium]|nr:gamma-glutamyltransferase [Verrucomicrobiota bacterium]
PPQAAIDAKRWRLKGDGVLLLEEGVAPATRNHLIRVGHQIEDAPPSTFGGAQMIIRQDDDTYLGATDPRKDGTVGVLNQ